VTYGILTSGSGSVPGDSTNSLRGTAGNGGTSNGVAGIAGKLIIVYKTGQINATGGTITTSGDYTYHTFTASGTFTVL
jgi:hypothetical protein